MSAVDSSADRGARKRLKSAYALSIRLGSVICARLRDAMCTLNMYAKHSCVISKVENDGT
jgi:hypothetical protein